LLEELDIHQDSVPVASGLSSGEDHRLETDAICTVKLIGGELPEEREGALNRVRRGFLARRQKRNRDQACRARSSGLIGVGPGAVRSLSFLEESNALANGMFDFLTGYVGPRWPWIAEQHGRDERRRQTDPPKLLPRVEHQ
jgi:hypothetical protein